MDLSISGLWYALHDHTATTGFLGLGLVHCRSDGLIENSLETFLGQSWAFHALDSTDLSSQWAGFLCCNQRETLIGQCVDGVLIMSQVSFGSDEDDGDTRSMVLNLRVPFRLDIVKRGAADDGVANQEDISLRVAQRSETIVVFLTCSFDLNWFEYVSQEIMAQKHHKPTTTNTIISGSSAELGASSSINQETTSPHHPSIHPSKNQLSSQTSVRVWSCPLMIVLYCGASLLTSGIPQAQVDWLAINHDVGRIVVKDSGNVLAGEGIGGVRDKQASFTDSTVTNYDTLDVLHCSGRSSKWEVRKREFGVQGECSGRTREVMGEGESERREQEKREERGWFEKNEIIPPWPCRQASPNHPHKSHHNNQHHTPLSLIISHSNQPPQPRTKKKRGKREGRGERRQEIWGTRKRETPPTTHHPPHTHTHTHQEERSSTKRRMEIKAGRLRYEIEDDRRKTRVREREVGCWWFEGNWRFWLLRFFFFGIV